MHFLEVKSRNQGPKRLDRVTALAYIREPTQANATIGSLSKSGSPDVPMYCFA
jgi:hypothetical protein